MIHVTPLSRLGEVVRGSGATHLVTLLSEGNDFTRPAEIGEECHLRLTMHDIVEPRSGMTAPEEHHVEALLEFAERWDRAAPMVVNCHAGISRSTAAAYVICCALRPDRDERAMARILRTGSPSATPNALIVELGDRLLSRRGRMAAAIEEIGRGADAFEGVSFRLEL